MRYRDESIPPLTTDANFLLLGIICLVFLSKRKSNSSVKSSIFLLSFRLYSTGFTKSFNENFE